jgi:hypothetical protein
MVSYLGIVACSTSRRRYFCLCLTLSYDGQQALLAIKLWFCSRRESKKSPSASLQSFPPKGMCVLCASHEEVPPIDKDVGDIALEA